MTTGYSSMTKKQADQEIRQMQRFFKKKITSKESARNYLQEAGILTKSGQLAKRYRD